jgi:hypothetical protein
MILFRLLPQPPKSDYQEPGRIPDLRRMRSLWTEAKRRELLVKLGWPVTEEVYKN